MPVCIVASKQRPATLSVCASSEPCSIAIPNSAVKLKHMSLGRMLVVADPGPKRKRAEEDPVLSSFMSFLAADMQRFPENITALDGGVLERIRKLVRDVSTSPEEDLGDEALI